ncbi:hypothetical protein [Sebaldella sp. S0638]|uniref:hypothetical protein n=1 Tax=Sebaldella sp. S0638 TaxID=2957809 RepID=UPI00209ECF51|nr:hypothetical protein [Sebaldella sp. S0638]MCP1226532.1 hypothetical protein [Sebaldella sp. S0638]
MNLKEQFIEFDSEIKLKYGNRKEFCKKFSLNYHDINNLFGRIIREEVRPRVDIVEMVSKPLGYNLTFVKTKD